MPLGVPERKRACVPFPVAVSPSVFTCLVIAFLLCSLVEDTLTCVSNASRSSLPPASVPLERHS